MEGRHALVVGPTGAVGKFIVEALARSGGWHISGMSRSTPASDGGFSHLPADLLDLDSVATALGSTEPPTHVFYAARAAHGEGGVEDVAANVTMLTNVVDAAAARSSRLRHVHLVEGTKWYGVHLGPYRTPAREDDPRHLPPNFYYDQEDALSERQRGAAWTWSASRPNVVCGADLNRPRNLTSIIGAYASICRHLNVPLDFPGTREGYETLTEITDSQYLADALVWMSTDPRAANTAFNITNGDAFRWSTMWPAIASMWEIPCGVPRDIRLEAWMADKEPVWARIVDAHGLVPRTLVSVAQWNFGDFVFRQDWDVISDLGRLRRAGWTTSIDSFAMLAEQFSALGRAGILPPSST
jgi:nucleoside-diphosphate-sugar epimerase